MEQLRCIPHSTRSMSLVSSAVTRGHLPLILYLYISRTFIAVLVRSVKYWIFAWPSIPGWPKLSMMTRISWTALPTIDGSVAHVWKMLPATDFASASDVIALYSQWLTTRNHVPNSSATSRWVAIGSEAIMLQQTICIIVSMYRWLDDDANINRANVKHNNSFTRSSKHRANIKQIRSMHKA